jgi:hypothetical protein
VLGSSLGRSPKAAAWSKHGVADLCVFDPGAHLAGVARGADESGHTPFDLPPPACIAWRVHFWALAGGGNTRAALS